MVTLLTLDGVEEIDYVPSDAEIRASPSSTSITPYCQYRQ